MLLLYVCLFDNIWTYIKKVKTNAYMLEGIFKHNSMLTDNHRYAFFLVNYPCLSFPFLKRTTLNIWLTMYMSNLIFLLLWSSLLVYIYTILVSHECYACMLYIVQCTCSITHIKDFYHDHIYLCNITYHISSWY